MGLRVSYAPPKEVRIELMCHVSPGRVLCGVATWASTWAFEGGPYSAAAPSHIPENNLAPPTRIPLSATVDFLPVWCHPLF